MDEERVNQLIKNIKLMNTTLSLEKILKLDHSPTKEEIYKFLQSINEKSSPQEIKTNAAKIFTRQKVWIETKGQNQDFNQLMQILKIKQELKD
jgi:hypothetical protein